MVDEQGASSGDGHRLMGCREWRPFRERRLYLWKKRLREIDRRIRFLTKRIDLAEVVDPAAPREDETRIFFGATVTFANQAGEEKTVSIVGVDEIDTSRGYISWISPMARAFIKAREGEVVTLHAPGGTQELEIREVKYRTIPMEPFAHGVGENADVVKPGASISPHR